MERPDVRAAVDREAAAARHPPATKERHMTIIPDPEPEPSNEEGHTVTRKLIVGAAETAAAAIIIAAWLLASPALAHPDTKPHPLQASVAVDCGTATVTLVNGHTAPVLWTITTSDGAWTVAVDAETSHDETVTF